MDADNIYLDFSRETFFPQAKGMFPPEHMMNHESYTVCGNSIAVRMRRKSTPYANADFYQ